MALGTLADQLTYPSVLQPGERTEDVEKQLQGLLDLVGIGYLVERCGTKQNKESLFGAIYCTCENRSVYRDRLGTKVEKTLNVDLTEGCFWFVCLR